MSKKETPFLKIPTGSHWRTIAKMPYLNGVQLKGEEVVTIMGFKEESFYSPKDKQNMISIVMYVSGHSEGIILGTRKNKQLEKILGGDMSTWAGQKITIFPQEEKHFGEWFPVVNIKDFVITKKVMTPEQIEKASAALASGKSSIAAIEKHYILDDATKTKLKSFIPKK